MCALEELVLLWVWFASAGLGGCLLWSCGSQRPVRLNGLDSGTFGWGLCGFGFVVAPLALWFVVVSAAFLGGVCGDAGGDDALDADGAVPKELGDGLDVPFEGGADSSWFGGVAFLGR